MSAPTPKIRRQRAPRPRAEPSGGLALQAMLEHVAEGMAMFDEGQRLIARNKRLQ